MKKSLLLRPTSTSLRVDIIISAANAVAAYLCNEQRGIGSTETCLIGIFIKEKAASSSAK